MVIDRAEYSQFDDDGQTLPVRHPEGAFVARVEPV